MPSWTPACLKIPLLGKKSENGGGAYARQVAPGEELNSCGVFTGGDTNANGETRQGTTVVELSKKDRSTLGLIISGGIDKGSRPKISSLRPGGVAYRSDALCVGDVILSVNGIRTAKLKHEEIVNLLKNADDRVLLEVQYEVPYTALEPSPCVCCKVIQVRLEKENGSFGFVLRGGANVGCPLTITYVRPGGPTDREGTVKAGDRLLAVDNYNLNDVTQEEIIAILRQIEQEALFTVEYDVSLMEAVRNASGPLLVEIERGSNTSHQLGIALASSPKDSSSILIQSIKQASLAERCGALHVGDQVLAIDGVTLDGTATAAEASQLLRNSCGDRICLEILPLSQMLYGKRLPDVSVRKAPAGNSSPAPSPSSFATLGSSYRNQGPSCPANSTWRNQQSRGIEPSGSSTSLPSCISSFSSQNPASQQAVLPCTQVSRLETTKVTLVATDNRGFGLALCTGTTMSLAPPVVGSLDPGGIAEKSGVVQIGDRILAVNGVPTENLTLEEVTQMVAGSKPRVVMKIGFDVAESVVPSSGVFDVRLPRKIHGGLGITVSGSKHGRPGQAPVISEVRRGSVAHRTGTIQVGDRLLAVGRTRMDEVSLEEVHRTLLECRDEVVRLRIRKGGDGEDAAEDSEVASGGWTTHAVELQRRGTGPLGLTVAGSDEPFRPVLISAVTEGGLACKSGNLRVGDRILAINDVTVQGRTLGQVIQLLQSSVDSVALTITRRTKVTGSPCAGEPDDLDDVVSKCGGTPLPSIDSAVESWDSGDAANSSGSFGVRRRSSGPSRGTPTVSTEGEHDCPADIEEEEEDDEGHRRRPQDGGGPDCTNRRMADVERPDNWPNSPSQSSRCSRQASDEEEADRDWIKVLSEFGAKEMVTLTSARGGGYQLPRRQKSEENLTTASRRPLVSSKSNDASDCPPVPPFAPPAVLSNTLPHGCGRGGRFKSTNGGGGAGVVGCASQAGGLEASSGGPSSEADASSSSGTGATPYPIELHRITLFKDCVYEDFGFSVSDGLYERGVYVNRIRPGGPADVGGILRPFDRILQVNDTKTHDFDCCLTVPLIAAAGDRIHLVVVRNPYSRCPQALLAWSPTGPLPWMEEEDRDSSASVAATLHGARSPLGPNTIVKSL